MPTFIKTITTDSTWIAQLRAGDRVSFRDGSGALHFATVRRASRRTIVVAYNDYDPKTGILKGESHHSSQRITGLVAA